MDRTGKRHPGSIGRGVRQQGLGICLRGQRLRCSLYLLACRWIEHTDTQPPTEFSRLLLSPWVNGAERDWIGDLWRRKVISTELSAARVAELRAELDRYASTASKHPGPRYADHEELNTILRTWVGA